MKILLGVTGGIASYKAVLVARSLVEAGHDLTVVPTKSSLEFVGKATWEAISGKKVSTEVFESVETVQHVSLGQSADLILVVPATANFMAKVAAGLADDLLSSSILAASSPVVFAPAMHTEMWENPATIRNVLSLRGFGYKVIEPAIGRLTGKDSGKGRLPEPETIISEALAMVPVPSGVLSGMKVLISAGGTQEEIDPVRFIGNKSSGKQGMAFARVAQALGAEVTLVHGNISVPIPVGVRALEAKAAVEMQALLQRELATHNLLIMAAAVSDYRVANPSSFKIKKSAGAGLQLDLIENPDILKSLVKMASDSQITVGFAAETGSSSSSGLELAQEKAKSKGADFLMYNSVESGATFGSDNNEITVLNKVGEVVLQASGSKDAVAGSVLSYLSQIIVRS